MAYSVPYRGPRVDPSKPPGKAKHIKIEGQIGSTWNHVPSPEQKALHHQRYINGQCVDCGKDEHAPGRTRCDECDALRTRIEPGLKRKDEGGGRRFRD